MIRWAVCAWLALLMAPALAQEDPPSEDPSPTQESDGDTAEVPGPADGEPETESGVVDRRGDAPTEVDVYGRLLVEQAKAEVYSDLLDAGYTERVRKDDVAIFRHPDPWKGEVHIHDDGWMRVKRQAIQIEGREMPWAKRNSPLAWAGCVVWMPLCVRPAGQTIAKRKYQDYEARVVQHVQPDVVVWGDRIADVAVYERVELLPERLEALWQDGVPLTGGPDAEPLPTVEARKAVSYTHLTLPTILRV